MRSTLHHLLPFIFYPLPATGSKVDRGIPKIAWAEMNFNVCTMDFAKYTESELLQLHAGVITELLHRKVVRTGNNPVGDYTEWLVCKRLCLQLQPNASPSYDGIDAGGLRYQIKGRRSKMPSGNVQFGVIRNLEQIGFDYLIAVAFESDYTIRFAAKIPHAIVSEIASYRKHVNGHVPIFRETVFDRPGVVDITKILSETNSLPQVT